MQIGAEPTLALSAVHVPVDTRCEPQRPHNGGGAGGGGEPGDGGNGGGDVGGLGGDVGGVGGGLGAMSEQGNMSGF